MAKPANHAVSCPRIGVVANGLTASTMALVAPILASTPTMPPNNNEKMIMAAWSGSANAWRPYLPTVRRMASSGL